MNLPFKIYSSKTYWKYRNSIKSLNFYIKRKLYRTKNIFLEEKKKTSSLFNFIKLTIWNIIKAVIFVSLLFGIEFYVTTFWSENLEKIPNWLMQLNSFIPKPTYPQDKDAIIELVSVIASVTGVILALFYPVLATIASTAYAKVHASIRNLLLSEKETQAYLKRLTYLTACSIIVLLFLSFNFHPGTLILVFLALYSFVILFGILKIGLGVYRFFEPSTLSSIVFNKLTEIIKNATTDGKYSKEKNFQNHYYQKASSHLENLSLITSLCIKDDDLKESSFKESINTSFYLLRYYIFKKSKIPVESLWFPKMYKHKSFFESDMTLRGLSKNTSTFIQPETIQNHFWFEEQILKNISNGFESLVKTQNVFVFSETIFMTHAVFNSLSTSIDMKSAKALFDKLLSSMMLLTSINHSTESYEDWKHELSCVHNYCYALLGFQIGIFERASEFDSKKIKTEYNKIDWANSDSIYKSDFITDLYELLNKFSSYIENEKKIEKKQVTPDWYFIQHLTSKYLFLIKDYIDSAINLFDSHLVYLFNHYENENKSLLASFTAQIGLEIISKLIFRIDLVEPIFSDIDNLEICKKEYEWSKPDFVKIRKKLGTYEDKCMLIIADGAFNLSKFKWSNQYPDIFAQSYSFLTKYINQAFNNNDLKQFQLYYLSFYKSSTTAFNNLNKLFKHYDSPLYISYQTLLDLMEISGYAYIYSILYNKQEYWDIIKETWDKNFSPSKENILLYVTCYKFYKDFLFGGGKNFNEKHERENTLYEVIKSLNINDVNDVYVKEFIGDNDYSNYFDVEELFIEKYLFAFEESKGAKSLIDRELYKTVNH